MRSRQTLRGVLVGLVALLTMVGMAASAGAQVYPPGTVTLTASRTAVGPGDPITFEAKGFKGVVDFTLFSDPVDLGSATANADGVAVLNTTIPVDTAPGQHTVVASGLDLNGNPTSVSIALTVSGEVQSAGDEAAGGDDAASGGLPRTGSDKSFPLARAGAVLVVAGGVLVLIARRRRSRAL